MEVCPLCNLEVLKEQQIVLKNEKCMFVQIPQEVLVGSGLIIPIEHRENVFERN
ncbi:hypothetical protein [Psychrobacillus vulpis]|uniref:hypothetical protein n=1 Tax=Psychrobacillus vulpis TaxID=2325572 RepID=UPI00140B69D5|nr:hypothetical protein [Psychrobacillus vulpis]